MLNLGCGVRFHGDWTNVDLVATDSSVIAHDLRRRLPFADNSYDIVYHSHVLEHFDREVATAFLQECFRVCRPGGIIRVAVPDLETISRLYLHYLDLAKKGNNEAGARYDWMLLELYDQTVRTRSGGQMADFLYQSSGHLTDFMRTRIGETQYAAIMRNRFANRTKLAHIRQLIVQPHRLWRYIRLVFTRLLLHLMWGREGGTMADLFHVRANGEIHQWMYDQYSLGQALYHAGFVEAEVCTAHKSQIKGWLTFCLDTDAEGRPYKPDSVYCEAKKPLGNGS